MAIPCGGMSSGGDGIVMQGLIRDVSPTIVNLTAREFVKRLVIRVGVESEFYVPKASLSGRKN